MAGHNDDLYLNGVHVVYAPLPGTQESTVGMVATDKTDLLEYITSSLRIIFHSTPRIGAAPDCVMNYRASR